MSMASCRIVIQARLSSSRLPAKSLLPLKGIPVAALCALRAANRGAEVVVATSTDPSDDILASRLSEYSIKVVRGPLNDVLERFILATADLAAGDLVVRLTADNVFPDGEFVDRLVREFRSVNVDYFGTNPPLDGLPYGLSAEVFTVRILREAARMARAAEDREHVTPWIRRHGICKFVNSATLLPEKRYAHLRCTIDTLEDYVRLAKLFDVLNADPVKIGWRELIEALADASKAFRIPLRVDKSGKSCGVLSLGTAQIGMPYGAANRTGQPSQEEATRIIHIAIDHGVTFIDTARAYGAAESRIGAALDSGYRGRATIATKLDTLANLADEVSEADATRAVDASVFRSCRELGVRQLDVLMLHDWAHRRRFRERVWQRLLQLREEGVIGMLGASVYSPPEAFEALSDADIGHIQLPYNLLDWRWNSDSFLEARGKRPDVGIHARSVYLQGILVSDASTWPKGLVNPTEWIGRLDQAVGELKRKSRADLCMAYVTGAPWATTVLVGAETERQLRDNLSLASLQPLEPEERNYVQSLLERVPERLLNPSMWRD
jgi:spore coat polysaccharide biosynthesis protein SpsF (cytidylyltransferase family)/aryl-alcohol dehydrogenase-like predicted oxidoreductase